MERFMPITYAVWKVLYNSWNNNANPFCYKNDDLYCYILHYGLCCGCCYLTRCCCSNNNDNIICDRCFWIFFTCTPELDFIILPYNIYKYIKTNDNNNNIEIFYNNDKVVMK